jgi:decaprenylphospho-beta-D-erythro-pentofuranosid-2-ulose 2-reductase
VRLFKAGVSLTDIRPGFVATPMTQGLALPAALGAQPEAVARRIPAGLERGTDVLYTPMYWALIMRIIRNILRPIFKRLKLRR